MITFFIAYGIIGAIIYFVALANIYQKVFDTISNIIDTDLGPETSSPLRATLTLIVLIVTLCIFIVGWPVLKFANKSK